MSDALFWFFSALLVAGSLGVVLSRNLYRAAYSLAVALVATAVLYLLLSSPLLGAVQLLLYTGGVLTLVVYALVLTESVEDPRPWRRPLPALGASALALAALAPHARELAGAPRTGALDSGRLVGPSLFKTYMVPFELLSVLLLAALFGALVIARKEKTP